MEQKRNARQQEKKVKVDMNPMVDMAFLLLTFFMMATTFSKPQAMELIMPASQEPEEATEQVLPESKVVTIVLGPATETHIYRGITDPEVQSFAFSMERINPILQGYQQMDSSVMVLIKPMDSAPYKEVVDILDELNQLGLTRYVLMEVEESDRKLLNLD